MAQIFYSRLDFFTTDEIHSMKIQASVLHGVKDLRLEDRELHQPQADEVQVAVEYTGLCGSDLHYFNHYRNGDILVREPLSLGHESAGTVTAIGSNVSSLAVGDRVALEVGVPCEQCRRCKEGRYNICKSMRFRSSGKSFPHFQGTLQSRINHPAKWCHKLPHDVTTELGAVLEPLSVALHAYKRSVCPEDARVLVIGAGAIGLLCASVVKMKGAKAVVLADIDQGRLKFAMANKMADKVYTMPRKVAGNAEESIRHAETIAKEVQRSSGVEEFDVVFECTGVPACVQLGIYATCAGGRLMLIGMGHAVQTLPLAAAALREVDVVGVFRYANTYPEGIALMQQALNEADQPDLKNIVTHRVSGLGAVPRAFELASRPVDEAGVLVLKVMVVVLDHNGL